MKLGIVGCGYVGTALERHFGTVHQIFRYDKYKVNLNSATMQEQINQCDLTFVAVPTPSAEDGWSCSLGEIEEAISWIKTPVCIKSTVPPGTTERLAGRAKRGLAFSPEYIGESRGHKWSEVGSCGFVIIGGPDRLCDLVEMAYLAVDRTVTVAKTDSVTAELCKYMENAYLATKVAFVNQFSDIAHTLNVDFSSLRRLWLLDDRIGDSHTEVTLERGFGGRCLPKDMRALISSLKYRTSTELLEAVLTYNDRIRCRRIVPHQNSLQAQNRSDV
jgi:UDPglucose 6-dehydrogenase